MVDDKRPADCSCGRTLVQMSAMLEAVLELLEALRAVALCTALRLRLRIYGCAQAAPAVHIRNNLNSSQKLNSKV